MVQALAYHNGGKRLWLQPFSWAKFSTNSYYAISASQGILEIHGFILEYLGWAFQIGSFAISK